MKIGTLLYLGLASVLLLSCNNSNGKKSNMSSKNDVVLQQEDGTITLKLEKAACYSDINDPSSNTAEWNVVISTPGRYSVWLSSATKDTLDLNYTNTVKVNFLDNQLEVDPACDRIVKNSEDVPYPYYRADSYMGSFYVMEPGEYNIQVISEKIVSKELRNETAYLSDNTRLVALSLAPVKR